MSEWKKRVIIFYALPIRFVLWTFIKMKVKASPSMEKLLKENPLYAVAAAMLISEFPLQLATTIMWVWAIAFPILLWVK